MMIIDNGPSRQDQCEWSEWSSINTLLTGPLLLNPPLLPALECNGIETMDVGWGKEPSCIEVPNRKKDEGKTKQVRQRAREAIANNKMKAEGMQ